MTADPTPKTDAEAGEPPTDDARRDARKLLKELDGPVDEHFKRSLVGLSSQLGERTARQSTNDPQAAAEARRAALQEYDLARGQRLKTALRAAGVALATVGVASLTVFIAMPPDQPPSRPVASGELAAPIEMAAVTPAPIPTPSAANTPSPPAPLAIVPMVAEVVPATASEPDPLRREEVKEVQTRLYSFGFNPGPLDGAAGPMTRAAIARYQQNRDQLQTAAVDRGLLEQLRQDPAPQVAVPRVAQRPARTAPSQAASPSAAQSSDPFEPLRTAANRFEQWVQSLGR